MNRDTTVTNDVTGIEFTCLEDHIERFRNEVFQINNR